MLRSTMTGLCPRFSSKRWESKSRTPNSELVQGRTVWQTALMLEAIEEILPQVKADWVLLYGDTNSTLAAALAAWHTARAFGAR
jgi:UDP-N-acetylglucosamine 2-epimerase